MGNFKKCNHISKTLYILVYFCLCVFSLFLVWEVLLKYASKNSSFQTVSLPITRNPVITICFPGNPNLTYGEEFTIFKYKKQEEYWTDTSWQNNELIEGKNINEETNLVTIQTAYMGKCFQLTSLSHHIETKFYQVIAIKFKQDNYSSKADLYFTSKSNANGALMSFWMDGDNLAIKLKKNTYTEYGISHYLHEYLEFKNKCTLGEKSFYECLKRTINSTIFSKCSAKCLPFQLSTASNGSYPMCKINSEENNCIADAIWQYQVEVEDSGICKRPCTINEYHGYRTYWRSNSAKTTSVLSYYFLIPRHVTGRIEYLIFDTIGMFTAIGGTLGLCIGFSLKGIPRHSSYKSCK